MPDNDADDTESVRLAIVFNGGVSLAVWMGAVTHEIDRLRTALVPGDESAAWTAILRESRRRVEIDIVAGASAGGLNGAILASAIGRGAPLPHLRDLWSEAAQLRRGRLLRPTRQSSVQSLFDGKFFEGQLQGPLTAPPNGPAQDVTLLVTATALSGSTMTLADAGGTTLTAGDNRRVFRFRSRRGQVTYDEKSPGQYPPDLVNEFDQIDPLRLAARASCGFPLAFAPVLETPELNALNVAAVQGSPSWLVDGGVLDNAPFEPMFDVLDRVRRSDPGPRWVVYVVPDADAGPTPSRGDSPAPPWSELPGLLFGLSRQGDFRDDLAVVRKTWERANRIGCSPESLLAQDRASAGPAAAAAASAAGMATDLRAAADALFQNYRRTCVAGLLFDVRLPSDQRRIEEASPQVAQDIDTTMTQSLCWVPESLDATRQGVGGRPGAWQWGTPAARRMVNWVMRDARGAGGQRPFSATDRDALALIAHKVDAVGDREAQIAQAALQNASATTSPLQIASREVSDSGILGELGDRMGELIIVWTRARKGLVPSAALAATDLADSWSLLLSLEVTQFALLSHTPATPPRLALHIVSPAPQTKGTLLEGIDAGDPAWAAKKLYGTRLARFGAFGSSAFRQHDWLWGRIDGAITLAGALLGDAVTDEKKYQLIDDLVSEILEQEQVSAPDFIRQTHEVMQLTPGQIVAEARDATHETRLFDLVDDATAMLSGLPVIQRTVNAGLWRRTTARLRTLVIKGVLHLFSAYLKRLIRSQ